MADGSTKPIEDVGVGDQVIATDPASGVTAIETVTAEIVGQGLKRLVRLDIELNDEAGAKVSITATSGHPFWLAESKVWVDAASVQPGDQVATLSEGRARVLNTSHTYALDARVYNLTTSSTHTYYVLAGQTPVLVHNSGGCITMSSAIGGDSSLVKAAQQAGKNQKVQADLDSLFQQLSRGNMNPGLGSKALSGTDVTYARGRNGGRLFFRNVDGGIQVVGKSDKANESKVIARLNQLYGQ